MTIADDVARLVRFYDEVKVYPLSEFGKLAVRASSFTIQDIRGSVGFSNRRAREAVDAGVGDAMIAQIGTRGFTEPLYAIVTARLRALQYHRMATRAIRDERDRLIAVIADMIARGELPEVAP